MATFIDSDYVDVYLGSEARTEMSGSLANLTVMITDASALVASALENAGYDADDIVSGSEPSIVKQATYGQVLRMLYERRGLDLPARHETLAGLLSAIYDGSLPIVELTPDAADAVGGVSFSDNSATAREPVFAGVIRDNY